MGNEEVGIEQILRAFKKMNIDVNTELLKIDQQMNRRVTVMEVQMDSIERKLNLLDKDLREEYFSIGRRLDLLQLQLFKNGGEQNKHNEQRSAEEIQKAIKNMNNDECWKLLNDLYDEYYNKDDLQRNEVDY